MNTRYLQLTSASELPDISDQKPFLAILVIEEDVNPEWRDAVSLWLVKSGCKNLLSWGKNHSIWEQAVDLANIHQFDAGEIPEDELVLTSEQTGLSLEQFIKEAKTTIMQDCADFNYILILHISKENKERELLSIYSGT